MEHRVQNNKTKNEIEMIILIPPHPSPKNKYLHTKMFFREDFPLLVTRTCLLKEQRDFKDTPGVCLMCGSQSLWFAWRARAFVLPSQQGQADARG